MSATAKSRHLLRDPVLSTSLWHTVDAAGHRVGRLSTQIAKLLMGKHKPTFNPAHDCGDFVVVYNTEKVLFTGNKWLQKLYRWHTRYPGGLKEVPAKNMLLKQPDNIIRKAVSGMVCFKIQQRITLTLFSRSLQLPKNRLRKSRMRRLRIYVGTEHPHAAQACPSTQYSFAKWRPKSKEQKEEESGITTPEEWKAWEQDAEAHKGQMDVYFQRVGGVKVEMKAEDNGKVTLIQQVFKGTERATMRNARYRRTRRTERLRALVEGISQDTLAEKLWRERLH